MTSSSPRPRPTPAPTEPEERGDWFFDELMTPQPDATQDFLRRRLEALQKDAAQKFQPDPGDAPLED